MTSGVRLEWGKQHQHATTKIPGLAAANDTLAYTYRWNAISDVTMPGNLIRTVTLDPLQRPTKIEVKGTGNLGIPVLNHRYEYDEMSNITKKTTLDGIYEYAYDEQDRLTDANPPDILEAGSNGLPVESYQYDGVHNRMNSAHQPGQWIYNANNELNTWGIGDNKRVLTYDDNGSTTREVLGEPASKTTDYVYDAQDRLIEVKNNAQTVARYAYDPMGRRVWRETFGADATTTWFLYSDEGLIGEYNQNGAPIREYGWNPGGLWGTDPVWQKDASGTYLAHNDHLFTTDRLTKATDGRVAWTGVREAFGKTSVAASSQVTYLLRFPGQWEDGASHSFYNFHRNFVPNLGIYFESDPIASEVRFVMYAFAGANPITNFDSLGLVDINLFHQDEIASGINLYQSADKIRTGPDVCSIAGHGLPGLALHNGESLSGKALFDRFVKTNRKCSNSKIFILLICDAGRNVASGSSLGQDFADAAGEGVVVGGPDTWIWFLRNGTYTIHEPKSRTAKSNRRGRDLTKPGNLVEFCGGCRK